MKKQASRKRKSDKNLKTSNPKVYKKSHCDRMQKYVKKQNKQIDADERLVRFRKAVRFGPIFVCRCCERKLFEHQVKEVDIASFEEKIDSQKSGIFSQCVRNCKAGGTPMDTGDRIISSFEIERKTFICKGCKISMERGKMPKLCSNNNLTVDILPDPKLILTELENNLIAKNIIFQKLHKKPKSRWSGTHDRLVNIPIGDQDILNTVKNLPRTPAEAGIITVKLKRKLEYKNNHTEQLIDTRKIYKYLL